MDGIKEAHFGGPNECLIISANKYYYVHKSAASLPFVSNDDVCPENKNAKKSVRQRGDNIVDKLVTSCYSNKPCTVTYIWIYNAGLVQRIFGNVS